MDAHLCLVKEVKCIRSLASGAWERPLSVLQPDRPRGVRAAE